MNEYVDVAESLRGSLGLSVTPIAVVFSDSAPEGVPKFEGEAPAGCVFWERAARGAFVTSTQDHELCSIGVYTHNLAEPSPQYESELQTVLKVLGDMEYVRQEDIPLIPVLNRGARHVTYAPLADTPLTPDAVLIFAHAGQSLVITEAVQQIETDMPPAMGRPACAAIPQAINNGRAALSLGCCGARAYLDGLSDEIAMWVLPGSKIQEYAKRLAVLAEANGVLRKFHQLRREDVEAGASPSYEKSMARLENGSA